MPFLYLRIVYTQTFIERRCMHAFNFNAHCKNNLHVINYFLHLPGIYQSVILLVILSFSLPPLNSEFLLRDHAMHCAHVLSEIVTHRQIAEWTDIHELATLAGDCGLDQESNPSQCWQMLRNPPPLGIKALSLLRCWWPRAHV